MLTAKRNTLKYFFMMPNAIFDLCLHIYALGIYAYLMRMEDRRTYQCAISYPTLAEKLGISVNTVAKYIAELEGRSLIRTERTEVMTKGGLKRNGCLRYTILPIQNAVELFHRRQLEKLTQATVQQKAMEKAEKLGVAFTPATEKETAPCCAL